MILSKSLRNREIAIYDDEIYTSCRCVRFSNFVLIPILVPLESFRQATSLQQIIVETNVAIIVLTKLILLQLLINFNDHIYQVWIIRNRSSFIMALTYTAKLAV